jgi:GT2 family glycosyltransferase
MGGPRASVIVVVHAGTARLDDAVASLAGEASRGVEVVVVDNGSADGVVDAARRRFPWATVVRSDTNLGFAGGVELGVQASVGDVLVLLNDDAIAGPGFVDAHLECLDRHPDAAASAGRLVSWDGRRHDFVRGRVTFDAHAFQVGQGTPIEDWEPPAEGEPLPFACGGNMAVRRADWDRAGGFDTDLFAYFEDVELGWRLTAMGRQVVAAPDAVARHRGSATSAALGDFRRGVLFERNALRVFFACADRDCREAFGTAVLVTFIHRLASFAEADPDLAWWAADPFSPSPPPPDRTSRWTRRLRERGPVGTLRHLLQRALGGPRAGMPTLDDGHVLMQLRAARGFAAGLEATAERRRSLDRSRKVSDRELIARFPRLVVPTYRGDSRLFGSQAFRELLPADWSVDWLELDEVVDPSVTGGTGD